MEGFKIGVVKNEGFVRTDTEKAKQSIRIQLNRSITLKESQLKGNCTLPNIKIQAKTPMSSEKSKIFEGSLEKNKTFVKNRVENSTISLAKIMDKNLNFKLKPSIYLKSPMKNSLGKNYTVAGKSIFVSKFKLEDPYVYSKIMGNIEITPFQKILSSTGESNTATYPYFTRVSREIKKIEQICIKKIVKKPIAYHICSCTPINPRVSNRHKPTDSDLQTLCDDLHTVFILPREKTFQSTFLIINFEGVIGEISQKKLKIRRSGIHFLQKVSLDYQLILITNSQRISSVILNILQAKNIEISGLYFISEFNFKELANFSKIYSDFSITSPSKSVLVISSLNSEIYKGDPLFQLPQRLTQKLNISKCPVSADNPPIVFLVPHMLISQSPRPFEVLLKSIKAKNYLNFQDWSKDNRVRFKVVRTALPIEIIMEKMPVKTTVKMCELHKNTVAQCEELPLNCFMLYIE